MVGRLSTSLLCQLINKLIRWMSAMAVDMAMLDMAAGFKVLAKVNGQVGQCCVVACRQAGPPKNPMTSALGIVEETRDSGIANTEFRSP